MTKYLRTRCKICNEDPIQTDGGWDAHLANKHPHELYQAFFYTVEEEYPLHKEDLKRN
jgi:hypothetical protein